MKKDSLGKQRKRILGMVMALVMLFGNSLSVLAASYNVNDLREGQELQSGDEVYFKNDNKMGQLIIYVDDTEQGRVSYPYPNDNATQSNSYTLTSNYRVQSVIPMQETYSSPIPAELKLEVMTGSATPSVNPGGAAQGAQKPKATEPKATEHYHDFQWKVVKDATLTEDGLAQSVCECGEVEAQQPVSSGLAFVDMVRNEIKAAPEGGTVEITSELYTCYTAKIMEELGKRPDVSLKTTFPSEDGTWKSFTIPAGQAPTDGELFYGFTYLGNLYGWKEQ